MRIIVGTPLDTASQPIGTIVDSGLDPAASGRCARPARTRDEALELLAAVISRDDAECRAGCRTILTEPEGAAKATIVCFHGLMKCPAQYAEFANEAARRGYRVLAPRQPLHGLPDDRGDSLGGLTQDNLIAHVNEAIDIAEGFGDEIGVFGLSAGGLLAYWAAATRDSVRHVAAVSPPASPPGVPVRITRLVARYSAFLPPLFLWFDGSPDADGEPVGGSGNPFRYSGFPLASLAPYIQLATALADHEVEANGHAETATLITNPNDHIISHAAARRMVIDIFGGSAHAMSEATLAEGLGWLHDFIDVYNPAHGEPGQIADVVLAALGLESPDGNGKLEAVPLIAAALHENATRPVRPISEPAP